MAGFGFVFWLLVARLFSTNEVGIATTLISVMSTIGLLGLAGFDTSTIRFLSNSKDKNENINTSITIVTIISFALSILFIVFIKNISPQLSFLQESISMSVAFVLFCIFSSLNLLTDAIFLSFRSTKFTFVIDAIFSFIKIFLPFAFIKYGAFGILVAAGVSQGIGVVISIAVLIRKFNYHPKIFISKKILNNVWKYSGGNYLADAFNFLPTSILPLLIINKLGTKESAYYFIVMMIVGLLYVIPNSITRSLFSEVSFDENSLSKNIKKTVKHIFYMLTPAILVLLATGGFLLNMFGHKYNKGGVMFLYIMTLSSVLVGISSLYASIFRLTGNIKAIIIRNIFYSFSLILIAYLLLPYGLVGIGLAYAISGILTIFINYMLYNNYKKKNKKHE